ncbi:MAG: putative phosphoesterase [uncultured Paraburkholderia sp.]|nr:MAG: putative phosphoesterase [uncultured Paraburkholderia sp.]CAH2945884.1 MAG: putative phosphoesterase [uncultured Paraburkholderia sp.]
MIPFGMLARTIKKQPLGDRLAWIGPHIRHVQAPRARRAYCAGATATLTCEANIEVALFVRTVF